MATDPKQILAALRAKTAQSTGVSDEQPSEDSPPTASPMTTSEPKEGEEMHAKVNARLALDLLQQTLAKLSPQSEMAKKLMPITVSLGRAIGLADMEKSSALVPSQIRMMMGQLPQTGNATPGQKAAAANPMPGMQPPQPM